MKHPAVDFQTEVIERSRQVPVLVDFWAPWCGPCKMLKPQLERLVAAAGGEWELVKINTDEQQSLAQEHGVRGIPDVRLFHQGVEVDRFSGYLPEPALRQWLADHLPSPRRDALARAQALTANQHAREAAALLEPLHAAAPDDAEVTLALARALLFVDSDRAANLAAKSPSDEGSTVTTLAQAMALLKDPDRLPPSALRELYFRSLRRLQAQDFRPAAEGLVDLLLEKPAYDEGRARHICRALFQYLGLRHAVTEEFFRRYSMAVNC